MQPQRMRHAIFRAVRIVAIDRERGPVGTRQHRIREAAVGIVQDADLNLSEPAVINRCETVDGHHHHVAAVRLPRGDDLAHPVMKRHIKCGGAGEPLRFAEIEIAGNIVNLAFHRHGGRRFGRPVAIIDETRKPLIDERGVKFFRKQPGNGQSARIPGCMARKHLRQKTQCAEFLRNGGRGMFADEKDVALRRRILDANGLPFCFCEKP